jgi:hypothetical protein
VLRIVVVAGLALTGISGSARAGAEVSRAFIVVSAFSSPGGGGVYIVYTNGYVGTYDCRNRSLGFHDGCPGGVAQSQGGPTSLAAPLVGGAVAPDNNGYWLVAADGGLFAFRDAHFFGSMGATHLNQPVFSMTPTRSGNGYWLVARDGGIFTFGDGRFYGSTGAITLNQPIGGITRSATGKGYRLVARDGGIFSFGDAAFYGSLPQLGLNVSDVVGMATTPTGKGYWIAETNGVVHAFGDATNFGNLTTPPCDPVIAITSNQQHQGYALVLQSGAGRAFGNMPVGNFNGATVSCFT